MDHGVALAAQHPQHMCHGGDISVELMGHCMGGGTAGQGSSAGVCSYGCLHLPAVHIVEDYGRHLIAKGLKEFPGVFIHGLVRITHAAVKFHV